MPLLHTFRGRPCKSARKGESGKLKIRFVSPLEGQKGEAIWVTEAEYQAESVTKFYSRWEMPDVRALAASTAPR